MHPASVVLVTFWDHGMNVQRRLVEAGAELCSTHTCLQTSIEPRLNSHQLMLEALMEDSLYSWQQRLTRVRRQGALLGETTHESMYDSKPVLL